MNNLTKYILFVFTNNDNPKEFTENISEDLSVLSDSPTINFFYSPGYSIFTLSTLDCFIEVEEYINLIMGIDSLTYILLPYNDDNMSFNLLKDVAKHLFNDCIDDFMSGKIEKFNEKDVEVQNMINNRIREEFLLDLSDYEDDDEDDDILKLKTKKRKPTFDELFEKIAETGVGSLTNEEKKLLNHYTNK